jgi:nanoRNase/pAp phosphatase (c-di-AMP/oligoRNAs hydrolase)
MYGYPSETAAFLRKELGSDIEVLVSGSGKFSIRSVPPISHKIAKEFGGGGHPNAAGGFFNFTLKDKILLRLLKKNRWFEKIARYADSIRK